MELENKLKKLNVVEVAHVFAFGPHSELEKYLYKKVNRLFLISHPFSFREEINSFYRDYKKGRLLAEHRAYPWRLPQGLWYLKDGFYTLWWVLRYPVKLDLFIGLDNFSAFFGLILKRLGKVKNVILYTIDYMPQRFTNPIFNSLYHFFDRLCLKHCMIVWNASPKIAPAREQYKGLKEEECVRQLVVPMGVWNKRIPKLPFEKRQRWQIIFLGHLLEKQGLDVVIRAMPTILREIPETRLVIVGVGEYEESLKQLVKKLNLTKSVVFTGAVERHEDAERLLSESSVSVAMYKPDPGSFTYWGDPMKIKNYMASGLPVILTSVPHLAEEVESRRCGVIAEYSESDFAEKTVRLLKNVKILKEYQKNALKWAKEFDWDKIFTKALEESFKL